MMMMMMMMMTKMKMTYMLYAATLYTLRQPSFSGDRQHF